MSVKIIVDSGADLPLETREKVTVLPLSVRFDGREYADGVELSPAEFYEKLAEKDTFPTTSQIPPDRYAAVFEEIKAAGDTAVVITLSSELSGTYQSAMIAAMAYAGVVYVVDGRNVAIGGGILAEYAITLADRGNSASVIARELMTARERVCLLAVVDTLEYLKKGGRVSAATAFAGNLLGIKPIIGLKGGNGKVEILGKARGSKQAIRMVNAMAEELGVDPEKPVLLGYTGTDDKALQKYLTASDGRWGENPRSTVVGSAIGAHAGPGAIAVAFFEKE